MVERYEGEARAALGLGRALTGNWLLRSAQTTCAGAAYCHASCDVADRPGEQPFVPAA